MHFPSLSSLTVKATATLKRFPFTVLSAVVAAFILLTLIGNDFNDDWPEFFLWTNGLMACAIGLTLFTALSIYSEVRMHTVSVKWMLQVAGVLLLGFYFYSLPVQEPTRYEILRFMIYNFCGHLLVAFLPYVGKHEPEGFWGFNKSLFLRFLTSALYSAVLFVGLAVALLAIDNLFAVDLDERNFARLYVIIVTIFNTWFFLSGVPDEFASLQQDPGYPKGLKIFTQYVLLPIITIYMLILYAYMGKIIISGEWPEGWVSWLVLCFSVAGILALLLVWPVRNDEGNTWMRIYARWFYIALFPLVIMLFLSIRIRIQEYGITEGRYYVGLLAFWLAATAGYFLFSKTKSIKVIPVSLFIIGVLSVHGPWSSFSVSKLSQLDRLKGYLESNKMLVDSKVVPATGEIPKEDHLEIIEKVQYLNDFHGYPCMQELFTVDLDSVMVADSGSRYVNHTDRILALMNLERISRYDSNQDERYFMFNASADSPVIISGYDQMVKVNFGIDKSKSGISKLLAVNDEDIELKWEQNAGTIELISGDSTATIDVVKHIRSVFNQKKGEYTRDRIPAEEMTLTATLKGKRFKILIRSSNGNYKVEQDRFEFSNLELEVFYEDEGFK